MRRPERLPPRDPAPIRTDRPYGGWLYLGLALVGHSAEHERSHRLGVDLLGVAVG